MTVSLTKLPQPFEHRALLGFGGRFLTPSASRFSRSSMDATVHPSLLKRLASRDPKALEACIDRYGGLIWSIARRLSPTSAEAEDAVQEIFIELWESAHRFDAEQGSEVTFIATIARRRLIDRLRADGRRHRRLEEKARHVAMSEDASGTRASDAAHPLLLDEVDRIRSAMAKLSAPQQEVLQMAIHYGCTHDQIARQTGLPLGTVKTHARRGLQRLRDMLGANHDPAAEAGPHRDVS